MEEKVVKVVAKATATMRMIGDFVFPNCPPLDIELRHQARLWLVQAIYRYRNWLARLLAIVQSTRISCIRRSIHRGSSIPVKVPLQLPASYNYYYATMSSVDENPRMYQTRQLRQQPWIGATQLETAMTRHEWAHYLMQTLGPPITASARSLAFRGECLGRDMDPEKSSNTTA